MPTLNIRDDEHVFIAGMTGCGKTVCAEIYTAGMDNVIKVDTKQEYESKRQANEEPWRGLSEGEDYEVCFSLDDVFKSEFSKIIYVVPWDEQNNDNFDALCKYVFEQGNIRLWIDELMTFCGGSQSYPKFLKAIYTAGRTRKATVIACAQRPVDIPSICIANNTHYFIFALPQEKDRKKLYDVTGCRELMTKPKQYVFWYYKEGWTNATQAKLKL